MSKLFVNFEATFVNFVKRFISSKCQPSHVWANKRDRSYEPQMSCNCFADGSTGVLKLTLTISSSLLVKSYETCLEIPNPLNTINSIDKAVKIMRYAQNHL